MLKKVIGVILATSMLLSSNVLAEEFSTKPMVSTNEDYTLALKSDGTVWAWGENKYGSLGIGYITGQPLSSTDKRTKRHSLCQRKG